MHASFKSTNHLCFISTLRHNLPKWQIDKHKNSRDDGVIHFCLFTIFLQVVLMLNSGQMRLQPFNLVFKTTETFSTLTSLKLILFNVSRPMALAGAGI